MEKTGWKTPRPGSLLPPSRSLPPPFHQGWAHGAETRDVAAEGLNRPPTIGLLQQGHRELSGLAHCAGDRPGVHYWQAGSGAHSFRNMVAHTVGLLVPGAGGPGIPPTTAVALPGWMTRVRLGCEGAGRRELAGSPIHSQFSAVGGARWVGLTEIHHELLPPPVFKLASPGIGPPGLCRGDRARAQPALGIGPGQQGQRTCACALLSINCALYATGVPPKPKTAPKQQHALPHFLHPEGKRVMFFFFALLPKRSAVSAAALRRQQVAVSEKYAEEAELGQSPRDEGFALPV